MGKLSEMKKMLNQYKKEAESLLAENKTEEAEAKTVEIKVLKAKIEVQEELEKANKTIEDLNNKLQLKDETINNLSSELNAVKNEKNEIMEKFNTASETITELNDKIQKMQPIVDKYNEEQYNKKLNEALDKYKNRFEKHGALELFESEEVQNLIKQTIDDDDEVSNNAKYLLSEKLMELVDASDSTISVSSIQEPAQSNKNLYPDDDTEFEAIYGFKRN